MTNRGFQPFFTIQNHAGITTEANEGILSTNQLKVVILHNQMQDLHQTQSQMHYDNCAFREGSQYIADEWSLIGHAGTNTGDVVLAAFGRLLHAVQDFYAHSNWVELHAQVKPIPVWDLAVATLPSKIVSGTWSIGSPKRCAAGAPTHSQLNKDQASSQEGSVKVEQGPNAGATFFALARDCAVRASIEQLARLQNGTHVGIIASHHAISDLSSELLTIAERSQALRS